MTRCWFYFLGFVEIKLWSVKTRLIVKYLCYCLNTFSIKSLFFLKRCRNYLCMKIKMIYEVWKHVSFSGLHFLQPDFKCFLCIELRRRFLCFFIYELWTLLKVKWISEDWTAIFMPNDFLYLRSVFSDRIIQMNKTHDCETITHWALHHRQGFVFLFLSSGLSLHLLLTCLDDKYLLF